MQNQQSSPKTQKFPNLTLPNQWSNLNSSNHFYYTLQWLQTPFSAIGLTPLRRQRTQLVSICHCSQNYCKMLFFMASSMYHNRLITSVSDCILTWHFKPERCLIHISNQGKRILLISLKLSCIYNEDCNFRHKIAWSLWLTVVFLQRERECLFKNLSSHHD